METFDYIFAWGIYLVASFPLCIIVWKILKRRLWRELAYFFQGVFLALVYTPWYVLADQEILAPAMIIFVMDWITIGSTESIRSLIPLVMAMLLVIIATVVLSIIYRLRRRKKKKRIEAN